MAHTDNASAFLDLDNDALDDSGNGHDFTNANVTFDGTKGTFNGTNARLSFPTFSTLIGSSGTVSIWILPADVPSTLVDALVHSFVGGVGEFGIQNYGGTIYSGWNGFGADDRVTDSNTAHWTNTLQNFVLTWTSGGTTTLYRNGSSLGTHGSTHVGNTTGALYVGYQNYSSSYCQMTAQSLGIYSDVKDSTWVTEEWNSGTPNKWADWAGGAGPTAVSWWAWDRAYDGMVLNV